MLQSILPSVCPMTLAPNGHLVVWYCTTVIGYFGDPTRRLAWPYRHWKWPKLSQAISFHSSLRGFLLKFAVPSTFSFWYRFTQVAAEKRGVFTKSWCVLNCSGFSFVCANAAPVSGGRRWGRFWRRCSGRHWRRYWCGRWWQWRRRRLWSLDGGRRREPVTVCHFTDNGRDGWRHAAYRRQPACRASQGPSMRCTFSVAVEYLPVMIMLIKIITRTLFMVLSSWLKAITRVRTVRSMNSGSVSGGRQPSFWYPSIQVAPEKRRLDECFYLLLYQLQLIFICVCMLMPHVSGGWSCGRLPSRLKHGNIRQFNSCQRNIRELIKKISQVLWKVCLGKLSVYCFILRATFVFNWLLWWCGPVSHFKGLLCLCPPNKWSQRHYVFNLSVCLCVRGICLPAQWHSLTACCHILALLIAGSTDKNMYMK